MSPQLSGQDLCLPTCRLGCLQGPGPFNHGHFHWQLVKTLGMEPGYANYSNGGSGSLLTALPLNEWHHLGTVCVHSFSIPHPLNCSGQDPNNPFIPTLLHRLHHQALSALLGKCILNLSPSLHHHPHCLWLFPPHRSPQSYFSSFNFPLPLSSQSDPLKSDQIHCITPGKSNFLILADKVLSDKGPASQSSSDSFFHLSLFPSVIQTSHALPFLPHLVWNLLPIFKTVQPVFAERTLSLQAQSQEAKQSQHLTRQSTWVAVWVSGKQTLRGAESTGCSLGSSCGTNNCGRGAGRGSEGQVGCDTGSTTAPVWSSAVGMTLDLDPGWPGLCTCIPINLCMRASLGHLQQHPWRSPSQKELTAQGCSPILLPEQGLQRRSGWHITVPIVAYLYLVFFWVFHYVCLPLLEFKCHRSKILPCLSLWPHEWWMNASHLIFTTT